MWADPENRDACDVPRDSGPGFATTCNHPDSYLPAAMAWACLIGSLAIFVSSAEERVSVVCFVVLHL